LPPTFSTILSSWIDRLGHVWSWRAAAAVALLGAFSARPRLCAALVALFLATRPVALHGIDWDMSLASLFAVWLVLLPPSTFGLLSQQGVPREASDLPLGIFRAHAGFLYVNGFLWTQLFPDYHLRSVAGLAAAAIPGLMMLGTGGTTRSLLLAAQLTFHASTFRREHALVHGLMLTTAILMPGERRDDSERAPKSWLDAGASCALALTLTCIVVLTSQWFSPNGALQSGAELLNDLGHLAPLYRMH
jgi:hypothetical protein